MQGNSGGETEINQIDDKVHEKAYMYVKIFEQS